MSTLLFMMPHHRMVQEMRAAILPTTGWLPFTGSSPVAHIEFDYAHA